MTQKRLPLNWFVKTDCLPLSEKNKTTLICSQPSESTNTLSKLLIDAQNLWNETNLNVWLMSVVNFCNEYGTYHIELSDLFHQWTIEKQQLALDRFSDPELVHCVNAIFFYKLYPDKLFNELIHPEKLVSVRMRLGMLHHFIEVLQMQLYNFALPHGLKPELDYLFHGEDLPQGIVVEVNEQYVDLIQAAVTHLKIKFAPENEAQVALERLQDLGLAYKFWFNPNRLIDAVMVLQQCLVKTKTTEENNLLVFSREMIGLFGKLTTTECLDLYGYFSNKDSRYLFYTLLTIIEGKSLDWLHELNLDEKTAITAVFHALQCVMEALRVELKNRHMHTDPYHADLSKQYTHAGRRNREAVYRIIAIYGGETVAVNESVERLFNFIEENNL